MTEEHARRVVLSGVVPVGMPPERAIELFTAEGERSWVPGWHPTYPDPATADDTEVGVIWQTQRTEGTVTWVVADRQSTRRRYVFFCLTSWPDVSRSSVSPAQEDHSQTSNTT